MKLLSPQLFFLLLSTTILLCACSGQNKSNDAKENELQNNIYPIPVRHNLPSDSASQIAEYIVNIFEDSKGNLWFGTMAKGAVRYDGKSLTYFNTDDGLCGNTVASIAEDKEGNIWFGTHTGASKFDGKAFTSFWRKQGLHGPGCKIMVDRKGNIWAGTNYGVFRYHGSTLPNGEGSFSKFKIPDPDIENLSYKWEPGKAWSLMEDSKGNIWFGRDGFGACKFDGTSFTHFTKKDGLCSNNVSSILEDKTGNIWFGSLTSDQPEYIKVGGLSRYDGKSISQFPELNGLIENDIYTIGMDKTGNVWIGATGLGVYRYDGEKFTVFNDTDRMDLTYNFGLQAILEDKNGTLWLGFSGGLFRFDGTSIVNVTKGGPWP